MTLSAFSLLGLAAGVAQASLLARASRTGSSPLGPWLRMIAVGVVLTLAALRGHPLAAAAGWVAGFSLTVLVAARRMA